VVVKAEPERSTQGITEAERDRFKADGFLGPIDLLDADETSRTRVELERVLRTTGVAPSPDPAMSAGRLAEMLDTPSGGSPVPFIECRHLDSPAVHRLCTHPTLLAVARALYGDDLLLWRSTFLHKAAGGAEFRWHQDWGGVFGPSESEYGLEPPLSFSFWIALSDVSRDNGCLRFVPGVRRVLRSTPAGPGPRATLLVDESEVDEARAVDMPLRAGQCVVFTDRALHASGANTSGTPRLGLAVRMTVPAVRVRPHFPGHSCVLVSGRDAAGLNTTTQPPVVD
jgi:hypothetical protein